MSMTKSLRAIAAVACAALWAGPARPQDATSAAVVVHVPPDAAIYFDGSPKRETGTRRTFYTPDLEPGWDYHYRIRAEVERGGQLYSEVRRVRVRAGSRTTLDLRNLGGETDDGPPVATYQPPPVRSSSYVAPGGYGGTISPGYGTTVPSYRPSYSPPAYSGGTGGGLRGNTANSHRGSDVQLMQNGRVYTYSQQQWQQGSRPGRGPGPSGFNQRGPTSGGVRSPGRPR